MGRRGPKPGSEGAKAIGKAHKGSHEHDHRGGFAANPELARIAGTRGGNTVKAKYGPEYYEKMGQRGGAKVSKTRGREYFAEIGRRGGLNKGKNRRRQIAAEAAASEM